MALYKERILRKETRAIDKGRRVNVGLINGKAQRFMAKKNPAGNSGAETMADFERFQIHKGWDIDRRMRRSGFTTPLSDLAILDMLE